LGTYRNVDSRFVETWPELRDLLFREASSSHVWRGMGDAEWCIKTSFERFCQEKGVTDRRNMQDVLKSLYAEKLATVGEFVPTADLERWALGQHWGLPTPLLDWTTSPMVAVYFALSDQVSRTVSVESTACVWRLDTSHRRLAGPADISIVRLGAGPWNARLRAQRGLFLSIEAQGCLVDLMQERGLHQYLHAYTFPARIFEEALVDLEHMTIDDLTLFPDQSGVVRYVRTQAARSAFHG